MMVSLHEGIPSSRVRSQHQSLKMRSMRTKKRMHMTEVKVWTYLNWRVHQVSEASRTSTLSLWMDPHSLLYSNGLLRAQGSLDFKYQHESKTTRQKPRNFHEKARIQSYLA